MAKPSTRQGLIDYCFRKLGAPVLEINVDDDQVDDLVDDTIQYYNERHYNGIERMFLKYKITQEDIDRGTGKGTDGVGIVTSTGTQDVSGYGTVTSNFYETSNFISVPDHVIGVEGTFNTSNNLRKEGNNGAIANLSSVPNTVTVVYTNKPHWTSTLDGGTF